MSSLASLAAWGALMVAVHADAPVAVRLVLSLIVFFAAAGWALLGAAGRTDHTVENWSVVVGLSVAVDFLVAELLVVLRALTLDRFLVGIGIVIGVATIGALVRRQPTEASP
jgi:hypothetical protein